MSQTTPGPRVHRISPFLWFDTQAEAAANYYVSIFPNSRIANTVRYPAVGQEVHGKPAGSVMTVAFELDGLPFTAINGGPQFTFNQAVSFVITCDTQEEVDYFWNRLTDGGDPRHQQCGWLTDKFGMVWQVVPQPLVDMITDTDATRS